MACYIAKCSNDKLGINHENRVVQDVSERIKRKFEKLSSNSRISDLWATYHGFICLINDFIRAERLHDFDLHLAIVAKVLPIFAAAGQGQYSKALRLHLEQMTVQEIQYGALVKTFKVVGLHTVRYTDCSGVWTDLSIEQRLMDAAKSSGGGGGGGGCLEGECALMSMLISYGLQPFNQMALINESID